MSAALPFPTSEADWAAQLAAERARREQSEAALATATAQVAALKQQLATTAHRHHAQLTALVHTLRVGLVLVDDAGEIQFVNQHFWEMFGLAPVAGPAEGGPPIPHAALYLDNAFLDPLAFQARAQALHAAGETVKGEEFLLADGRVVELDYLVLNALRAGRLICYRDVTERHQREAQLRLLAIIPEQNPNAILQLAATGEVLYANPAAALLVQVLAADAPGALHQQLRAQVRAALQSPGLHQHELAVAGEHYLLTAGAVPGAASVTLYLTNITARHRAEQELGLQRAFYESVLAQVPAAVAVFDAEQRYLFVNSELEPNPAIRAWMLGKTNEEACAYRQRPLAVARQRRAAFEQAVRERREVSWEETHPDTTDGIRYRLLRFRPVLLADGTLPMVISSGVDITGRKQADEKLAKQQEFYESILNLLPVDVAVFDAEHRFLFANPSSISDPAVRQEIIGLTNKEYFVLRQQFHMAGLAQQREQYFDLAVRTRTDVTWEEMRTDRHQRPQLMLRHLRPVFDADGTLRLVVGSGIDITARYAAEKLQHQVQAMLQGQEAFIRQIVDALPDVLYLVAPDSSISFFNRPYQEAIALSAHQHGASANPAVREEMRQMQLFNQEVWASREAQTREMPFTNLTGETLYYQVHKQPMLQANGEVGILTVSTDGTAVKRARQALERREKQYHDLVYYSQALICTHNSDGTLLSVNPAIERLMGVPAAQLVGRNLREAMPPEHGDAVSAYLAGTTPVPPTQPRVVAVRTKAGEKRYLHCYTYQVSEADYPPYVVASGYDVTEGYLARQALQQAKQEAEENAQAKEAFLARMSHEIRTPLNGVLGMAALLQKTELTTAQREYLRTMQLAGRHLLALVNDVLDMAKITTQPLELEHAPFDLALMLQGAGQTVAALAAQKGLAFSIEPLATAATRVVGDAYRLHQVLLNLLGNAIKFTERGRVQLGTDVLHDTPAGLTLRFWVADTGIGMTTEEQAHIFKAFAQANAETSRRYGGTGLGLAISQQLVAQMGGTLSLSSVLGEGTTFSFQLGLPRAAEAAAAPLPALPSISYEGLRGLRVLLAEDNLVNQQIAIAVLENWGVHVTVESNGTNALTQLQEHAFDVALLDIRMPGLNGVEVTTAIRRHPDARRATIPIIALTANAFTADRAAYLAAGMNACLTKPYEEAALCQLLLDLTKNGK